MTVIDIIESFYFANKEKLDEAIAKNDVSGWVGYVKLQNGVLKDFKGEITEFSFLKSITEEVKDKNG